MAVAVVGIIALTLSACSAGSSTSSVPSSSNAKTTLTVILDGATWPSLDTASSVSEGAFDDSIYSLIYGDLFTVGKGDSAVPGLATGYSWSSNHLTFTLRLRSGVKFQDGTPFDSTAVKDSLERDLSPTLDCSCIPALSAIKSITTPTATEVVLHLSHTDGVLLSALETSGASYVSDPTALAKEGQTKYALSPVGAGPFRLVKNIVSSTMTLQSWSGYWDAKAVHLKTIKIISESNTTAELATMKSGGAQLLVFAAEATEEKGALADSNLHTVTTGEDIGTQFVYLNPGKAPLNNKLAREALFYATDQAAISKAIFYGLYPPTEQLLGTDMQGYSGESLPGFLKYDPAKAKALVKKLGGLSVDLLPLGDTGGYFDTAEALEKEWDAVGINTTLVEQSAPTTLSQMEKADYEAIVAAYPGQTNAALALEGTLVCKSFFNPDYCNPIMSKDEKAALNAVSLTQQTKLLRDAMIQAVVKNDVYLPITQFPGAVVAAKNLHDFQVYGGELYFGSAYFS